LPIGAKLFCYQHNPYFYCMYKWFLHHIVIPTADVLLATNFSKELKNWRNKIAHLNAQQLQTLQQNKLNALLKHATNTIPYYQSLNIKLSGNAYADVKQFPILYKQIIKDNFNDMFVGDRSKLVSEKSSGSSGIQGEVLMSKKENTQYQAAQTFLWEWNNYSFGSSIMQTGITPNRGFVKSIKDKLFKTQYVDAYNISYNNAVAHLQKAKENNTQFFGGYASSLNVYAQVALKAGIDIQFEGVLSWGDKLFDHYKNNINKAFGNPFITEQYGTTEGFVISGTCRQGNHHLLTPQTYIELLDKDGNEVKPGELGYVVVTRLDAYIFPLIRYYLGDLAIKEEADKICTCGRHFPLLQKIVGRDTDVIQTPSGKYLIVHFFTGIFEHFPQIQQFRVVQKEVGKIAIEYIPSNIFSPESLENITHKMYERAEERFPVEWKQVANIPPTASGKPQVVQSLIANRSIV
jgi:phenylacetate-CoA ligase